MTTYQSDWRPSERLRRLARKRGLDLDALPIHDGRTDIPLAAVVARSRGRLDNRFYHPLVQAVKDPQGYKEFNARFPTLAAFQEGLLRNDDALYTIRNCGPITIAAWSAAFLDWKDDRP